MKMIFSLIFISIFLLQIANSHKCIHDTLNVSLHKVPSFAHKHPPPGFGKVSDLEYQNIRIYADYNSLKDGGSQLQEYIKNQLMPSAIGFFQSTLKVVRTPGVLQVYESCGGLQPSPSLMTTGVDADLIILVTAQSFTIPFVAAAMACGLSDYDYRPVYGVVYFNLKYLSTNSATALEENLSTILHEMTHILGFASDLYEYYINPSTGQFLTNQVGYETINGHNVMFLNVEPLTSKLRNYFQCPTLKGAYLEDAGSEGSAGSHFERRVFMNEFMTASTVTDPVVSEFTLALLEGTGWYKVDYGVVEPFTWGKNQGCSFLNGPCVDKQGKPNFEEFCSPLTQIGCSYSARAFAVCGTIGSVGTDPAIDPSQDYWGNQTTVLDPFGDNCPYYIGFSFSDCETRENQKYAFLSQEKYGPSSRCFPGTLSSNSFYNRHLGFCFPTECESQLDGSFHVKLKVGNDVITCTKEEKVSVQGYYGYLECPDPDKFCEKANPLYCERGCSGRGKCVNKQCICPQGWTGPDCGLRTYVANCDRCKNNGNNNACFGDGCLCIPGSQGCSEPERIGTGGEYISPDNSGGGEVIQTDMRKVGIFIWVVVCVVVLLWKAKLTPNRRD